MKINNKIVKKIFSRMKLKHYDKTVHFTGKKFISIGENTLISQNTWLNVNLREKDKHIIIGNYCFIGRNNFFTSGNIIHLDDYIITSVNCCFIGTSHNINNPFIPYYFSPTSNYSNIIIGTNVFIGANVTIIGEVEIGYGSVIGANTTILNKKYPPFSLIVGNNGELKKRFSFQDLAWKDINLWTEKDELKIFELNAYKEILKRSNNKELPYKAIGKTNGDLFD